MGRAGVQISHMLLSHTMFPGAMISFISLPLSLSLSVKEWKHQPAYAFETDITSERCHRRRLQCRRTGGGGGGGLCTFSLLIQQETVLSMQTEREKEVEVVPDGKIPQERNKKKCILLFADGDERKGACSWWQMCVVLHRSADQMCAFHPCFKSDIPLPPRSSTLPPSPPFFLIWTRLKIRRAAVGAAHSCFHECMNRSQKK